MRRYFAIVAFGLFVSCPVHSYARNPEAYLNFASFSTPSGQSYLETYLSVIGSSLKFVKNGNNKYTGRAHVTLAFMLGDSMVASANFNVMSPEVADTLKKPNFIDVHRFWVKNGNYLMVFTLDDPEDASHKIISGKQFVRVGYGNDTACVSDAEFLQSYTQSDKTGPYNKCGFTMIPYVYADYPASVKKLVFYCEIYHTDRYVPREKVTVQYSIEDDGTYSLSNNFSSSVQRDADTVIPFLAQVPIDNLPTGSYYLAVSVVDMNHHVLAKKKYSFTKENPAVKSTTIPAGFALYMANKDTLTESIRCLAPISKLDEQDYVIGDSVKWMSMTELKRFFYYFWLSRDSVHPLIAWQKYLDDVMKVNNSFKMREMKGYRTDRGRVYLQYGPPNIRDVSINNPTAHPYEIWEYYRLKDGQTDVKFVFFTISPETNNYELLHSTATGEIHNPHWQAAIYNGNGALPDNLDQEKVPDQLGEQLNDEFNNPH